MAKSPPFVNLEVIIFRALPSGNQAAQRSPRFLKAESINGKRKAGRTPPQRKPLPIAREGEAEGGARCRWVYTEKGDERLC